MSDINSSTDVDPKDYKGWGPSDHANADLKMVSSDDRSFWVSSTQLSHHSPIFASMIATCKDTSECVQLADPHSESARSIVGVLLIIAVIEKNDQTDLNSKIPDYLCPPVVLFAQKYDMRLLFAAISSCLFRLSAEYPPRGVEYFREAAHMSEWALCGRLIAASGQVQPDGRLYKFARKMLDPRGWTPRIMGELSRVSTRFAWAVHQTGTKHGYHTSSPRCNWINYGKMGEDLARLMSMKPDDAEEEVASWTQNVPSWAHAGHA